MDYLENARQSLKNTGEIVKEKLREELKDKGDQVKGRFRDVSEQVSEVREEVLRTFFGSEYPPNKVIESKAEYFRRHVHCREDGGLVLYSPDQDQSKRVQPNFEIVLHLPTEAPILPYSLYRTPNLEEAEAKLTVFKDKIPILIEVSKDMANASGIQKMSDALSEHPTWTVAHLAAYFALYDSFNDPRINCFLNSPDDETGMSPLQVAITTHNLKTVQMLIAANCSLEHLDHDENSVFHFAASSSKEIISALGQGSPPRCLNSNNKNGYTPLHLACLADKPDCVHALLLAGADVNKPAISVNKTEGYLPGYVGAFLQNNPNTLHHQDMKFGGTPLHWARSRLVIETLVDMNCDINALNFQQRTALHIMVLRNRLECVVALLSREALADIGDSEGNRPLHLAVQGGHLPIIQSLIIFGASLDILNNVGESPRHMITKELEPKILYYLHAVGAKRCLPDMPNCTDGCRFDGTFDGVPPPFVMTRANRDVLDEMLAVATMERAIERHGDGKFPNRGRLLALDGGGIRGLILSQMLLEVERYVQKPLSNCFDWIAGTSTGGILALAIASGKTMKECQCLYFRLKEITFVGRRPYSSEALETVLKETFGTETKMADIKYPKVMITGTLANRKPVELHLFRNYQSPSDILGAKYDLQSDLDLPAPPTPEEQYVWQVGRATGAAPTYFRAFGPFLDGGLIANNPTLDALTEIHEHCLALRATGKEEESCPVSVVISLGTGQVPVRLIKELDPFRPESIWDSAKLVFGISNLGALLVDQATQSDGRVVDRARAWCASIGVPFFRFSPQMSEDVGMDEKSDERLCRMLWETKAYMHENLRTVKELADILNK